MINNIYLFFNRIFKDRKGTNKIVSRAVVMTLGIAVAVSVLILCSQSAFTLDTLDDIPETPVCGIEAHEHTQNCWSHEVICDFDEADAAEVATPTDLAQAATPTDLENSGKPAHVHTEDCYNDVLICGFEKEHIHQEECYPAKTEVEPADELEGGGILLKIAPMSMSSSTTGTVTVKKEFEAGTDAPTDNTAFTVVLTPQNGGTEYTFTLNKDNNWTDTQTVVNGTYDVSETNVLGYETVNISDMKITVGGSRDYDGSDYDGLIWEAPGTSGNPFGSANYFSVLTFGDFSVQGADVESGLAIGGKFTATGGYSVGMPYGGNTVWPTSWNPGYRTGMPIAPHSPRLLVKGDINLSHGVNVYGGSIIISDNNPTINIGNNDKTALSGFTYRNYTGTSPYYDSTNPKTDFYDSAFGTGEWDSYYRADVRGYDMLRQSYDKINQFFNDAATSLKKLSADYAALGSGGNIYVYPNIIQSEVNAHTILSIGMETLPSGVDTIVFNVKAGDNATLTAPDIIIPENYSGKFIINILPNSNNNASLTLAGACTYINGSDGKDQYSNIPDAGRVYALARDYADRIIWNFPSDTMINIETGANSFCFIGSVLAPYSNFTFNSGHVNGTLVANSVTATAGWETHSTTEFGRNQPGAGADTVTITVTNRKIPEQPTTYDFKFMKVDENNNPLEGAKFDLYSDEACTSQTSPLKEAVSEQTTGIVKFTGLNPDTYYMKEITPPLGYKLDDTVYKIEIAAGGNIIVSKKNTTIGDWTTVSVEYAGLLEIKNVPAGGPRLPETGGTAFPSAIAGTIIMCGAAGAIICRKKIAAVYSRNTKNPS